MRSKPKKIYDTNFYDKFTDGSYQSAKIILGILFQAIKVRSIVDVGCGIGTWLRAAKELGCKECLGIEGDWAANKIITKNRIIMKTQDLEKEFKVKKKYDLAISMEVAEHLSAKRGESFIKDVCRCSDVILFSAAVPGQGGVNHINERSVSFWASIFAKQNFIPIDCIRPLIFKNPNVERWYRRNSILYVSSKHIIQFLSPPNKCILNALDIMPPSSVETRFKQLFIKLRNRLDFT